MEIEYSRDLHHNYMLIKEPETKEEDAYCLRMLKAEGMNGVISLERRNIDNQVLYYYDITAKQALSILSVRTPLSYDRVKRLFLSIIGILEKAYEFLLKENDFILTPETIFLELSTDKLFLCYLPGYQKDIKEQLCNLMEYIMNKVDYNDKEAVLLIYNLYAAGKEEGYSFDQLLSILMLQPPVMKTNRDRPSSKERERETDLSEPVLSGEREKVHQQKLFHPLREDRPDSLNGIPVMMEKITSEKEVACYPLKTYLYTAGFSLIILLAIVLCISSKILYNSLGNRIDYTKLFAISLLLFCSGGYVFMKLWDKKNRITRIVTRQDYIDPRRDTEAPVRIPGLEMKDKLQHPKYKDNPSEAVAESPAPALTATKLPAEGEDNPTCLLNLDKPQYHCLLKPLEEDKYERIRIDSLPFFIGKIKKSVDYCLEKDVVSRYHAKITREQEQYYLTDLNSTNGTFLNGEALPTYQPRELKTGDEVSFANIRYQFLTEE